jgi:hypothetical protein
MFKEVARSIIFAKHSRPGQKTKKLKCCKHPQKPEMLQKSAKN